MLTIRLDNLTGEWMLHFLGRLVPSRTWSTLEEARTFFAEMKLDLIEISPRQYRLKDHKHAEL